MGKLLIDLRNTREEAINVAELKSKQDQHSKLTQAEKEDTESQQKLHINHDDVRRSSNAGELPKLHIKNDDMRRTSTTSDISMDQDDDDDKEPKYRLDPK